MKKYFSITHFSYKCTRFSEILKYENEGKFHIQMI